MQEIESLKEREEFKDFLNAKGLSHRTIQNYMDYYNKIGSHKLDQQQVYVLLKRYDNPNFRSFIKHFIFHTKQMHIIVPKVTGTKKEKLPKFLNFNEVNRVIRAMETMRGKLMVAITFQCGLRVSELLNIKPFDFKWNEWKEDKSAAGELIVTGKGNKDRVVFISPKVMQETYKYVRSLRTKITKEDPIFRIKIRRWQVILRQASIRALGFPINPHALRHSTATYLLNEKGWDILELKEYLGHKNVATTQIYTHLKQSRLKEKFKDSF